jgi:beta-phosphoglucomutase-like phosphatase (HAD superfamily)
MGASEKKLQVSGLLHRFLLIVAGDQVERSKPYPGHPFARRRIAGRDAEKCLALEDPGTVRARHWQPA